MTTHRFGLNRLFGVAILVIALVALIGSGVVLGALGQLRTATAARGRSNEIIGGIGTLRAAMLDQETGIRGYLLTGRPTSLEPYRAGRAAFGPTVASIDAAIGNDGAQRAKFAQAVAAAQAWRTSIGETIVREMANPATRSLARSIESDGTGKQRFDTFRARLGEIEGRERVALAEQQRVVSRAEAAVRTVLWASALITLLICLGAGIALNRVIVRPLVTLATTVGRLIQRDLDVPIPSTRQRNEVGAMARAVQVLRESLIEIDRTSLLRVTADTLPAMVGYIDAGRKIGFLNGEFSRWFDLDVLDVAHVAGEPLERVFTKGRFPGVAQLDRALAGEEIRFAVALNTPNGTEQRDWEGYFRPHRAPDGTVLGVVTLFTDVTDRKDIDRRLRHQAHDLQRSNAELEQFAYVASHDLKAPLRGIENLASWIEEDIGAGLSGESRTNMDMLRSRVKRLESLLDDLLAYSRAGRDETVIRTVDSRALVGELAVLVSPPPGFVIEGRAELPTFRAAQAGLGQVLQNLIGNAIKHHPAPSTGHVWVDAALAGDRYEFTVADDGAGIPERYRDRVFGMFQTLRPRDEVEGSGMGLAIVRKLVERHGGEVWLADRPGGGLVVHFTWPAVAGEL